MTQLNPTPQPPQQPTPEKPPAAPVHPTPPTPPRPAAVEPPMPSANFPWEQRSNKLPLGWRKPDAILPPTAQPSPYHPGRTPELGETVHYLTRDESNHTVERPALLVTQSATDPNRYDLLVFFSSSQDGRGPQEKTNVAYAPFHAQAAETFHFAEES